MRNLSQKNVGDLKCNVNMFICALLQFIKAAPKKERIAVAYVRHQGEFDVS